METQALIIGFSTIMFFLTYLGWRFGHEEHIEFDPKDNKPINVVPRLLEAVCYSFAGLMATAMLFIFSETFAAETYGGVVSTVFYVFQIVIGLISGVGAIGFGVVLVVIGVSNAFKGVNK